MPETGNRPICPRPDPSHTLRVEFSGNRIAVWLDGTRYIDRRDEHTAAPGAVGVWTKADSATAFGEFSYGNGPR